MKYRPPLGRRTKHRPAPCPHVSRGRRRTRSARPDNGPAPACRSPPAHGSPISIPSAYFHRRRRSIAARNQGRWVLRWRDCQRASPWREAAQPMRKSARRHGYAALALCRTASLVMPWQKPGARVLRRPERASDLLSGETSKRRV